MEESASRPRPLSPRLQEHDFTILGRDDSPSPFFSSDEEDDDGGADDVLDAADVYAAAVGILQAVFGVKRATVARLEAWREEALQLCVETELATFDYDPAAQSEAEAKLFAKTLNCKSMRAAKRDFAALGVKQLKGGLEGMNKSLADAHALKDREDWVGLDRAAAIQQRLGLPKGPIIKTCDRARLELGMPKQAGYKLAENLAAIEEELWGTSTEGLTLAVQFVEAVLALRPEELTEDKRQEEEITEILRKAAEEEASQKDEEEEAPTRKQLLKDVFLSKDGDAEPWGLDMAGLMAKQSKAKKSAAVAPEPAASQAENITKKLLGVSADGPDAGPADPFNPKNPVGPVVKWPR